MPRFMLWCANEHNSFRLSELDSLLSMLAISAEFIERHSELPFVVVDIEQQGDVLKLLRRSVAIKFCIRLWAQGDQTRANLHQNLNKFINNNHTELERFRDVSFKMHVESFNKKLSSKEKLDFMDSFSYLPLKGKIDLSHPSLVVSAFEFYGLDHNNPSAEPEKSFLGELIGQGQRELLQKMCLRNRKFIGNTSMDPQLSLLMANIGQIKENELILDPFAGTGSLLLAAAHFGGYCFAADIDYQVMHARGKSSRHDKKERDEDESIKANFEQLGLGHRFVDNLVCDNSKPCYRPDLKFDVIITDPPYGLREPQEKIGTRRTDPTIPAEHLAQHYPQKVLYDLKTLYNDLLHFADNHLSLNGRLCFWLPVNRESYNAENFPFSENFEIIANCEQILSSHSSRRLIVLRKKHTASFSSTSSFSMLEHFLSGAQRAKVVPRRERKERIKRFGHLNLEEKH